MPYSGTKDNSLPEHVKRMSEDMRRRWVGAFNGAHENCMADNGDDCEGMAMRVANAAVDDNELMMPMSDLAQYTYNGVKVTASGRRASTRDDKKYMRTVVVDGKERLVHYGDPNMPMRRNNEEARQNFVARHNCSEKKDPTAPGFWACYDWENTSEMSERDNFLFFELQEDVLTAGRPFPGFATGEFTDMYGRHVEYKVDELPDYLSGTLQAIKDYQAKNMPGLPIDASKHDKGDAAGWIVGAEPGEVTDSKGNRIPVLTFLVDWTKLGVQKIKDKLQANFSPTVDNIKKAVVGGSLTNWAASVDDNGVPLFTAVELAQGIHYLQQAETAVNDDPEPPTWARRLFDSLGELMGRAENNMSQQAGNTTPPDKHSLGDEPMTIELTQEQLDELLDKRVKDALAELETQRQEEKGNGQQVDLSQLVEAFGLKTEAAKADEIKHLDQLAELVQQQAELQWQAKLAQMQRENRFSELAARVVGGAPDSPRGIPADADKIKTELMKLEPERAKFWAGLLETIVKSGLNDFAEYGHGKKVDVKREVPAEVVDALKMALDAGNSAEDFFAMAGYGSASEYDLSKFVKEDK